MTEEDKFDIYGDLNDFDSSVKLKEVSAELEALKRKHNETLKSLEASEAVNKHVKVVNGTVKKNFSMLLTTARREIQRKDGTIAKMRRDYDDMAFRRNKGRPQSVQRVCKATQTELWMDENPRERENGFPDRKNRYDRFKESIREQGYKRRHEESSQSDAKRQRSRPRSSSRERSHWRHRELSRERRNEKRDVRSDRRSREKSEKPSRVKEERPKTPEVPKKKIFKEDPEETATAVQNLLVLQQESVKGVKEESQVCQEEPQSVPEAELSGTTQASKDPEELPVNKSINLGNSDYSIASDSQGVVTVVIKRKKRKIK